MVKVDARKDYYADLGVSPNAGTDEIKKQFKRLALKYHPDRNPGREVEFISKFQAIQAAHEILCDPQLRLKYDTERLRAGHGKLYAASSQRANTARKPTTSTKPQPSTTFQASATSTGAQRYASYARAPPWGKWQDDTQTKADAFRGFQEMKGGYNGRGWSSFDPKTGTQPTANSYRASATPPRPKPVPTAQSTRAKSAYEYFKTASNPPTPEPKKKHGFAPRTAGGDEPPARNTEAYNRAHRHDRSNSYFESVPSPTAKKTSTDSRYQSESSGRSTPVPGLERTSTKYFTTGGEKISLSSPGLGRSTSVRDPLNGSGAVPNSQAGRNRSASPKYRTDWTHKQSSSTSSSDTETAERPKAVPKSRLRPDQKFSDFHTPQDWSKGTGHNSDSATFTKPPFRTSPTEPTTSATDGYRGTDEAHESRNSFYPYDRVSFKFSQQGSRLGPYNFTGGSSKADNSATDNSEPATRSKDVPGAFKSNSHDALHEKFSEDRWPGASNKGFDFTQPDSQKSRPQSTPFAKSKFSADSWAEYFKNLSWAAPTANGESQKPQQADSSAARSPRKQSRPAIKVRTAPRPASVSTEAEEAKTTFADPNGNGNESPKSSDEDVEAMDLDDDVPAGPANGPANAYTAPQSPPPQRNGISRARSTPSLNSNTEKQQNGTSKRDPIFNLKDLYDVTPLSGTNNGGIDNLQDIGTALPFQSRPKDQRTSTQTVRARQLNCPNPPKRPRPPAFIPASAGSKQLVLPLQGWNRYVAEMNTYMREWKNFNRRILHHFCARQEAMETGLAPGWISAVGDSSRLQINPDGEDNEGDGRGDRGSENYETLVPGTRKGGYRAYLRGLDEDEQVRKHWEVACEMHKECILELGRLRDWIQAGGRLV
ncbi:hypothetical protein MAP00_002576 [Monascus purpureus]|nr:hypothetical protein MAP00_002576 [Monascus purpureus]